MSNLDLSGNYLGDEVAQSFADLLATNQTIFKIDISRNCFTRRGAEIILKSLRSSNDTLESLGDLNGSFDMGIDVIEEIKRCLKCNELGKHMSAKTLRKDPVVDEDPDQINDGENGQKTGQLTDGDSEIEYKILKPIYESNSLSGSSQYLHWNI